MTRPFGSINIAAEMAVSMGMDPRPHLSEREIEKQARISELTVEQWHKRVDEILADRALPGHQETCPF